MLTIREIQNLQKNAGNEVEKMRMKKYLRHKFKFYGLRKKEQRLITKDYLKSLKVLSKKQLGDICRELYVSPYREDHHLALDIFRKYFAKFDTSDFDLVIFLTSNNSWWDSVDGLKLPVARILDEHKDEYRFCIEWAKSDNMWVRRLALITSFELKRRDISQHEKIVALTFSDNNFFIQKAIGWSLRDFAKEEKNHIAVIKIIEKYNLQGVAKNEALSSRKRGFNN